MKKCMTFILAVLMLLSGLPISVFAETDSGLCEHHHEHTAECGYVAAVEGQPCPHEHTDDCYSVVECVHEHDDACGYAEEAEGTPCNHICSVEDGCRELVCSHAVEGQHDDACGHVGGVEGGSPCQYECEENHDEEEAHDEEETTESTETSENTETTETYETAYTAEQVKAMIDTLPTVSEMEGMSNDELDSVYEQAQEAYDAFEALTDEEQIELADDLVKLADVLDFMTTPITPLGEGYGDYGIKLTFWGSYVCSSCGKDVSISSISIYNVSFSENLLIISATLFASCGHNREYKNEGSRLIVRNFSCTSAYSSGRMIVEGTNDSPGVNFHREAGHDTVWSYSNDTHSGYCNLCQRNIIEDCSGGTVTCQSKAVCSTCGNEYGSTAAHNYINNATSSGLGEHTGNCEWCSAEGTQACSYENDVCKYCGATRAAVWNGTEQVYEIYNLLQLQWFADKVNGGETNINGKLMNDINISSLKTFGIGTSENPYSGTFDGNGYTLTIGLNSTAQYAAPFRYVNGATIKNLIVKGSITTGQKFAASIVGMSEGTTKIENCLSYVTINSSVSGDGTHGGLVANVSSGTTTIDSCGFAGAINGSRTNSCGGLVGWSNGTTQISNSFVTATFGVKSDNGNTFSRGNNITVTNCYYLNALGGVPSGATQKSANQFAGGEVAWLLNGSDNGVWKQTIGTDSYPNFGGESVYKTSPCVGYSDGETTKDHVYEYGVCKGCGDISLEAAMWNESKNAYEIYSASQLLWFSKLVNGTLDDVSQNQSANAILMADIDMSAVTDYVPIGGTTGLYYNTEGEDKGYQGVFDGNGHVIKNLSAKGSDTAELTYGVFGTLS